MERRSTYWLQALCSMDEASSRAFTHMLGAKLKVQRDMREYLSVRQKSKASQQSQGAEEAAEEVDAETLARQFTKVGSNFPDPQEGCGSHGEDSCMKDGNIFRGLSALIKPETSAAECERITDDILKRIGSKNPRLRVGQTPAGEALPAALRPRARMQGAGDGGRSGG